MSKRKEHQGDNAWCSKGQHYAPFSDFGAATARWSGLASYCTPCRTGLIQQQEGMCAICRRPPGRKRMHVDHCHATGVIRGLLCALCNKGLGHYGDSAELLRRAAEYLESGGS